MYAFLIGSGLYVLIQTFIHYNWEFLYADGLDEGLKSSFDNGYIKPYFNLTNKALLHTELIIYSATILFCLLKRFRNFNSLAAFAFGLYLTGFVIGFYQNADNNLWPIAMILFGLYFIAPVMIVGSVMLFILKDRTGRKRQM